MWISDWRHGAPGLGIAFSLPRMMHAGQIASASSGLAGRHTHHATPAAVRLGALIQPPSALKPFRTGRRGECPHPV